MSNTPASLITPPEGYGDWLADLKSRIHNAQQRATLAVPGAAGGTIMEDESQ